MMPSSHAPLIHIHQLTTGYLERGKPIPIAEGLELTINPGEVIMLMGPNGSGKSTLMHTMAGLLAPLSGDIYLSGQALSSLTPKELSRQISLVLTERIPPSNMTVWDVVTVGRYPYTGFYGRLRPHDVAVCEAALERCHLRGMRERTFDTLSDGEKQRVMIARALAQETPLILLDEPTAHLDLPSRLEVTTMLRTLAHECGKSILISTHELDLALGWADTLWLLDRSGEMQAAAPEDLVLSGAIERVFGSEELRFDQERGEFSIEPSTDAALCVIGEGLRAIWTKRALRRAGFLPIESADNAQLPCIIIEEASWLLRSASGEEARHTSVTSLLRALKA